VGRSKALRRSIATFLERIAEHEGKIAAELAKPNPYQPLLRKWRKEIETFRREIAKREAKLPGGKR
jgi:hypothetical protein